MIQQQKFSRYMLFIGAFTSRMLLVCLMQNVGLFLLTFQQEFGVGAALVGWMGSLPMATRGLIGLPTGLALRHWSCRQVGLLGAILFSISVLLSAFATSVTYLIVTLAVIAGIGGGMLGMATIVVVEKQFQEDFALAHSAVSSGLNIGKMILPPLICMLGNNYGWRGALLIESALLFHCVIAASLYRVNTQQKPSSTNCQIDGTKQEDNLPNLPEERLHMQLDIKETDQDKNISNAGSIQRQNGAVSIEQKNDFRIYQNQCATKPSSSFLNSCCKLLPTFPVLIFSLIYLFQSYGFIAVSVHSVAKTEEENNVSSLEASLVLSLIGFGGIVGRFLNGIVVHHGWLSPIGVEITMTSFICVVTFIVTSFGGYVMGIILTTCTGFAFAFIFTVVPIVLKQVDDISRLSTNLGIVWGVGAIGDIGGGFLTGLVRDVTGNYDAAFYLAGGSFFVAVLLSIILYFWHKKQVAILQDTSETDV